MSKLKVSLSRSGAVSTRARTRVRRILAALAAAPVLFLAGPASAQSGPLDGTASLAADAATIAAEMSWNVNDTIALLEDQDAFNDLVGALSAGYPTRFSAAENFPAPGQPAKLHFKGTAALPLGAQALITNSGLSPNVYMGANETETQMQQHADAVADYLENNGYTDFVVAYNVLGAVKVTIGSNAALPTLPGTISPGVSFERIVDPAGVDFTSRGGATVSGTDTCTSGFSVENVANGVTGVSSAGHCDGLTTLNNRNGDTSSMSFEDRHIGSFGDMEWHTTGDTDVNEIWWRAGTDDDDRRDIEDVEMTITTGTFYCNFGITTGDDCDSVLYTSVAKGMKRKLVMMNNDEKSFGDSGGPWFTGDEAVGLVQGLCWSFGYGDCFSKASLLPDALGVEVLDH